MKVFVHPCDRLTGIVDPPSSKNYTTRYLLVSCLADGESRVLRPAVSDDAVAMIECARTLGARVEAFDAEEQPVEFAVANAERLHSVAIRGFGDTPRLTRSNGAPDPDPLHPTVQVNPHNAGAVLRLLIGTGALLPVVQFITDHPESLGKRPNCDLLDALAQLGVEFDARGEEGFLPITLHGGRERVAEGLQRLALQRADGGPPRIRVSGAVSSQYVSSILFLVPLFGRPVEVEVTGGLRSKPLVETTVEVLREAGVPITHTEDCMNFRVEGGSGYRPRTWNVNGDWPGASGLLAAAAVLPGSNIVVERLFDDLQGERRSLGIFEAMGCQSTRSTDPEREIPVLGLRAPQPGDSLRAADIDGDRCTDAVLSLYAAAALARGTTRIYGIQNLQYKECDRIREPLAELRKIYATLPEFQLTDGGPDETALRRVVRWNPEDDPDEVYIEGRPDGFAGGIEVDGHGDHRVIMMLSIVGLRCANGLAIDGAEGVAKSYPRWFDDLARLGARVDIV